MIQWGFKLEDQRGSTPLLDLVSKSISCFLFIDILIPFYDNFQTIIFNNNLTIVCVLVDIVGGAFDISNKARIGKSEVELVQGMIDGVEDLIKMEEDA